MAAMAYGTDQRQQEMRRYSQAVRWMKILLPIIAAVVIGLIFLVGRERGGVADSETVAAARLGAGLKLENPRFAGVTETGEPFVVTALSALPDGAMPNLIDLEQPSGEITLGDGLVLTARAETGEMFREDERLNLQGSVVIESSDGYRFETERVEMDLAGKTARAPGSIHAEGPRGGISADSVRMEQAENRKVVIRFEGNVRVTFAPGTQN